MRISMTIPDAVAATGIGRTTLYRAIAEGRLPARKLGKRTLILESDLRAFTESLPDWQPKSHPRNASR